MTILSNDKDQQNQYDELHEHHRIRVDAGQVPIRIDKFLMDRLPHISRTKLQLAIESGFLFVGQTEVKASYKVKPNDEILLFFPNPIREFDLKPEDIWLEVVYEDDDLIVINKSNNMVVHPGCGNYSGTLVNALLFHFGNLTLPNADSIRPGLVHRLDKHTSGLMVVAKTEQAHAKLAEQFQNRTIERRYHALVWGNLQEDSGTIRGNIGRAKHDRKLMAMYPEGSEDGKHAITHWRVLERFGFVTLIECKLETGRTHQIRVHLKSIGHPLFNDKEYGGDKILRGIASGLYQQFVKLLFTKLPSQALHAKTLGFIHPKTAEMLRFDSALTPEFTEILEKWRVLANVTQ